MALTLIGDYLPLDKRTNAIGWIVASGALTYIIGAPVISFIAGFEGWRFVLLGFVTPISLAGLLLAFFGLPSESHNHQPEVNNGAYLEGFKGVLSNRSANACLAGNILRSIAFMVVLLYGISFFREHFLVSTGFASIIMLSAASSYTLGSLICSRFVNRFGRKTSTVWTALLAGLFTISFAYLPNLWLSLALFFLGAWFFGVGVSAASSLTLEQVPKFRGTMMSLTSAAQSLGSALGAALGGLMLVWYDYLIMGSVLGALGIVAAIVFHFFSRDPTRA
jgi:DHA1 family putative efflux transporter-like MFS transporter